MGLRYAWQAILIPAYRRRMMVVLLCLVGMSSATARAQDLLIPRGRGESCVEPVDIMRKNHMQFLFHQRDATVHDGVRTTQHSLNECVACHVQQDSQATYIPIDAQGQFCEVCHGFASVKIDCFECHAARPEADTVNADSLSLEQLESLLAGQVGDVVQGARKSAAQYPASVGMIQ